MEARDAKNVEEILSRIGLTTLLNKFMSEKIDASQIETMSDQEMARLGITTIGDRIRLRESAKQQKVTDSESLPRRFPGFRNMCSSRQNRHVNGRKKIHSGSWTGQFFCLSSVDQLRAPTCSEKEILYKAGLGLKKVKMSLAFGEEDVVKTLQSEEGFPSLTSAGGFELLRTEQNCRDLVPIPGPWTSKGLRTNIGSQARIYIRPIQRCLSTRPVIQITEPTFKMACENCNGLFAVHILRDHVQQCRPKEEPAILSDHNENQSTSSSQYYVLSVPETHLNPQDPDVSVQNSIFTEFFEAPLPETTFEHSIEDFGHSSAAEITNISTIVGECITFCRENAVSNPVEMLRKIQGEIVVGRPLELDDPNNSIEGETNFVTVDRNNLLQTSLDEIGFLCDADMRKTLEVQFYNEQAVDLGGPRKEFFRLVLMEIKEKFFDNGIRELMAPEYRVVGIILAMSILQNGPMPTFLTAEVVEMLFSTVDSSQAIIKLREGFNVLGLYDLFMGLPELKFLLQPLAATLTLKRMITMLKPIFSGEGTNALLFEKEVYGYFVKYLREIAAGRRGSLTLSSVLNFVTCTSEEPVLGFKIQPSIYFCEVGDGYLPTASTCTSALTLPRPNQSKQLPKAKELFEIYDYAFSNSFYGLQ